MSLAEFWRVSEVSERLSREMWWTFLWLNVGQQFSLEQTIEFLLFPLVQRTRNNKMAIFRAGSLPVAIARGNKNTSADRNATTGLKV